MFRLLSVAVCVVSTCAVNGEQNRPGFPAGVLPIPPQQVAPWTPPRTRFSSRLISAARTLFEQGLADPRGCEYREIETAQRRWSDDRDDHGVVKSHGWVLPANPACTGQFAIRWDGLVYRLKAIGARADLRASLAAGKETMGDHLIPLCLLLRLGEGELAEWYCGRITDDWIGKQLGDPYLLFAREWAVSLLYRALEAHRRGDDRLSLETARGLVSTWEAIEAEATDLDLPRPDEGKVDDEPADVPPLYLEELKIVRVLLADQQRRVGERRQGKEPPIRLEKPSWKERPRFWARLETRLGRHLEVPQRIALVTRALEESDGDGEWPADLLRPYRAEAIEALLDCLENDTRLSRGGRDLGLQRVHEVAYDVLWHLLDAQFSGTADFRSSPDQRHRLAEEIRAHWKKVRQRSPEEEWYEVLRDDSESPQRWAEAVRKSISSRYALGDVAARRAALRKLRNPTMTELLLKRIGALTQRRALHHATELTLALAEWEPEAALPILRQQTARWCEAARAEDPKKEHRLREMPHSVVELTLARVTLKDPLALVEYAQLFRELSAPADAESHYYTYLPLLRDPQAPEVVALAEWMCNDPASPWTANARWCRGTDWLVLLAPFRKLAVRALADREPAGSVKVVAHDEIRLSLDNSRYVTFPGDPRCPPPGSQVAVRRCDLCAGQLQRICGLPHCELYWPEAERDRAVGECRQLLARYGHLISQPPHGLRLPQRASWGAQFNFPALGRPATREDVQQSRAVFSLEGEGPTRCCRLIPLPAAARWFTYRQAPYGDEVYDSEKKAYVCRVGYDQKGIVWQAEEVQVAGKWHRYYGFVGAGRITKVPAEQIEFCVPGVPWNEAFNVEYDAKASQLRLVNRSGLPQSVPRFHWVDDPTPAAGSTLVEVRLYRFISKDKEPSEPSPNFPDPVRGEDRLWSEVPRRARPDLKFSQPPAQLQPMEAIPLFPMLREIHYPNLEPGDYRQVAILRTTGESGARTLRILED